MFRLWLIHDDYSTSTARSVSKVERLQREIIEKGSLWAIKYGT